MDKAKLDLDGYRTSFGQVINSVLIAGDGQVFTKLAAAAGHMPMTAATLAGGIADN